ncbi:MAG: RNA polymerase sporulation sigma factor SigE [Clostridia bacterium]|nr:RNA polymerase sporulation sigma factor SigE [Clostridia bacterium]
MDKMLFKGLIMRLCRLILKNNGELLYIGTGETLPPPLTKDEEAQLLLNIDEDKNKKVLIERNLRLVVYIARKFENTGIYVEDLISIGTIGLIKAINTFRPEKNIKLATYASRCIENEILMYLRKNQSRYQEVSIDEPLNVDWDGNELLLSDILGTDADVICKNIEHEAELSVIDTAIKNLSPREEKIMRLRFGLGGTKEKTQKEVAEMLGISQSYISRLEKRIISRLKNDFRRMTK